MSLAAIDPSVFAPPPPPPGLASHGTVFVGAGRTLVAAGPSPAPPPPPPGLAPHGTVPIVGGGRALVATGPSPGALSKHVRHGHGHLPAGSNLHGMGLDPISASLVANLGGTLINDIFKPPAAGPTPDQVAALLAQQKAQETQSTMLAIALVGGAALAAITLSR